ncbi:TadE/TadG family type IV pilus assembly protein [Nocardioides sediminis]|uniref:TadE/TadG family type IV pilus assembly protein n=1 Tax=Nocardioides sediminis TaxID=433648 RepID=UPI00131EFB8B|nr:pilus assembly protein TadG-related protein [Nocardioides sediminis]
MRDERGAVAIIVAFLALFLVGLSVFAVDFGMAYANKRQAQTAADAAALGAAVVYTQQPTSGLGCEGLRTAGQAAADAEALLKAEVQNDTTMTGEGTLVGGRVETECTDNGLEVRAEVSTTSPNLFGGAASGGDTTEDYEVSREATAVVDAAGAVGGGLRPLALCSRDLLTLTSFPTPVMKFEGPAGGGPDKGTKSDCPDTHNPGNWWTLDCPGQNGPIADEISNGCENPVSIVPDQPDPSDPNIRSHLLGHCPTTAADPASCLGADTGNLRDDGSLDALKALVDSEEQFFLPVFCGTPTCNPGAVSPDPGGNTIYPVFRIISVRLCGYHLGNGAKGSHSKMTGDCANNPSGFNATSGGAHRNYLLVTVLQTNVSGSTRDVCDIGDPCDTGLRQVRMTG